MATKTATVITKILEYIRSHELSPGDPMPTEPFLTAKLGVSRSTLREAIRELRMVNIIEVRHGLGSFVGRASLSFLSDLLVFRAMAPDQHPAKSIQELVTVREMLEVSLAAQVCGQLTADQLQRLEGCCADMVDGCDNADVDRQFHSILYENVENEIAKQLIGAFWDAFDHIKITLPHQGIKATQRIHTRIVEAYRGDDIACAQRVMSEHFDFIKERLQEAIASSSPS